MSDPVRPRICLNMIVRDEVHVVREVLDAVAPYISSWVIVDTGSEDGTQAVIRGHMAGLGIPGELHERPWRNFGHNRSEALNLAQGHGDYIWVMDADDTVVGTPDFSRLGADAYFMRIRDSGEHLTYWRPQLFRDGMRWRYVGVIHEYPACEDPHVCKRLEGEYHIESRRLGARSLDRQKTNERDRDLLLAEVERNPDDAHSVVQLAQCYFTLGDFVNARNWAAQRAEMGGWDEEVYYSTCLVAESMLQLGEPWPLVEDGYLRAWEFRPTRAEPLYAIASRYRADQRYQLGHLFAQRAAAIPLPEQDLLFVDEALYNWRALDEQAVCASGIGKHQESFTLCRRLLARSDIPEDDRKRIAANRDVATPTMIDAAAPYPDALAGSLVAGRRDAEVTVSLIAGPDRAATEQTLNSFLRCCTDVARVGRFLVLDAGLSAPDQAALLKRYRFLEFGPCPPAAGPAAQLPDLRGQIQGRFWLHLGQGWRFFAPDSLISRLTAVLDAEPEVFQVGINVDDAQELTGACAAEDAVHRTADAGRYVPADAVARGPAMFETTRLDRAGGIDATDEDPIAGLGRRAAAAGLHTASLDEVLCIAKLTEKRATARTDSDSWDLVSSVGATATIAAAWRALATRLRFIDDPFAGPLVRAVGLDFVTRLLDGDIPNLDPQHNAQGMAVRTGFFDHFFLDATRGGIRQAVILASGLDARVYRLPWPHGTVVYEVDMPEVIEYKTTTLAGLGAQPKAALRIVAVDLRADWPRALREAGFATDRPAAWIAEGLLLYLPPDAQDALFDHITALSAPGSRLATDFLPDPNVLLDQRSMELQERLRGAGFGIDFKELVFHGDRSNVVDYLAGHGWSIVSSRTVEQLLAEHDFTYPDDESARAVADQRFVSAVLSA